MTDAPLLAKHLLWAAATPAAANEAFNVVNGDVFRWQSMWGRIAHWFGLEPAPFDGTIQPLKMQMANDARGPATGNYPSAVFDLGGLRTLFKVSGNHPDARGSRQAAPVWEGRSPGMEWRSTFAYR
jgi:hypothetical protein